MAHIALNDGETGIVGLLRYRPETARPLAELAEVLLRDANTLSRGERELIAAYVSELNECRFCSSSHGACAALQLPKGMTLVAQVQTDLASAPIGEKLRALLGIAASVQKGGGEVTEKQVMVAREAGATDLEIHDTVLIAAAFCMFNRYVDGLAASTPDDPAEYISIAGHLICGGYLGVLTDSEY
ncbi:carboxymuconolactone decarboxylase family protein [Sphaerisporangium sp. TRM90804]|uniref:carboxymuconolactone decarboxylase family protein n=1 Tax=Sphaerisporangium sp. TRM90804 TaxID=3031113 RepID=UPI002446ACE3|nr:carboxymuconolactone decarboxylase family protein [Sphaerisporangium sp. TRM90804]MDH2429391.1 carboxymuconolactone decarboxylase family protein [Sphaerisporangium sp. TRM90804]